MKTGAARGVETEARGTLRRARRVVNRFGNAAGRSIRTVATAPLRRPPAAATHRTAPGSTPGMTPEQLARMKSAGHQAVITRTDYGPDHHDARVVSAADELVRPMPEAARVRWIHIDRVDDPAALAGIARRYSLHPLAMEDVVHTNQRSKAELFDSDDAENLRLYLVARMVRMSEPPEPTEPQEGAGPAELPHGAVVLSEQVSFFLGPRVLITFTEEPGDVWDGVRARLARKKSRLREHGAPFLLYALLDAIADAVFPVLEHHAERIEAIEEEIYRDPDEVTINSVHELKRELVHTRRELAPMRDMLRGLGEIDRELIDETTRLFLRDVHDHAVQAMEALEVHRESASGLADTWMNAMSTRMNEVMKVLTVIASLFIPASFFAGVFGMNFTRLPLAENPYGFWIFVFLCGGSMLGLLGWFRWRKWI